MNIVVDGRFAWIFGDWAGREFRVLGLVTGGEPFLRYACGGVEGLVECLALFCRI